MLTRGPIFQLQAEKTLGVYFMTLTKSTLLHFLTLKTYPVHQPYLPKTLCTLSLCQRALMFAYFEKALPPFDCLL